MPDFDSIFNDLKDGAKELIGLTLKNYKEAAEEDVMAFLNESKDSLARWTKLLAAGDLSISDFEWLVQSQKDLLLMNGLKQAGLAKIRIDQFKNGFLNLISDKVLDKVL